MKYEYKILEMPNQYFDGVTLFDMGKEGWEFICFNYYISDRFGYFKKEIVEDESPESEKRIGIDSPSGY